MSSFASLRVTALLSSLLGVNLLHSLGRRQWTHYLYDKPATLAFGVYILSALVMAPLYPRLFEIFFSQEIRPFDAGHYLAIAENGYDAVLRSAFYPLWPLLLSLFKGDSLTFYSKVISTGLFGLSLVPLLRIFRRHLPEKTAVLAVWGFALSPIAVFYALGYSESLFNVLLIVYLTVLDQVIDGERPWRSLLGIVLTAALLSLCRPVLIQLSLASIATTLTLLALGLRGQQLKASAQAAVATTLGCVAGYAVFGAFCWQRFGHFWQPFAANSLWGREFGVHWDLIFAPKTIGGSDNVLVWDLVGFWLPSLLLLTFLVARMRGSRPTKKANPEAMILLALFFSCAQAAGDFFSVDVFSGLGRHVFAVPFFMLGLAGVLSLLLPQKTCNRVLTGFVGISALYLLNFWTRYANGAWLG